MITKLIWPKCRVTDDKNAFWVGCTDDEVAREIYSRLEENRVEIIKDIRLKRGASNLDEDKGEEMYCNFFLISADATSISSETWVLPYAGQWNASNPFLMIGKHSISSLDELKGLEEILKKNAPKAISKALV